MTEPVVLLLGPTAIRGADGRITAVSGQQGDALALLAAMHPHGVRTDLLADALWGEHAPKTSTTGLRVVMNRLRLRLEHVHHDAIRNEAGHYRLDLEPALLDIRTFEAALDDGRRALSDGRAGQAVECFDAALDLWRGDAFQSTGDLEPVRGLITALGEARADAEERLVEALMAAGRHDDAAARASSGINDFELRERRWELLMLSLYRAGRQTEALRAYQRVTKLFAEEYGLVPGPALADLERRIIDHDPTLQLPAPRPAANAAPERPLDPLGFVAALRRRPTVPAVPTPLIGRDDDLDVALARLDSHRLVTLVGPAGIGKTRLAAQVARDSDAGQVIWLDLMVHEPDSIIDELAAHLGVGGHAGLVVEAVVRTLGDTPTLIVFDNCEHVIDTIAPLAEALVEHCPGLRVLATSRVAFESQSETRLDLGPLDLAAARRLLLDRLGAPAAPWRDADLDELVEAVDRLPLAIELVAGRLRARPVPAVVAELRESIDKLRADGRTDRRHVGLTDALDWSIGLLEPEPAAEYDALGVFRGPFRPAEFAAVVDAPVEFVADRLERLVGVSLLERFAAAGEVAAYRSLETVRTHARARLVGADRLRRLETRHAQTYADLVHRECPELRGPAEELAVVRLAMSSDQLRAAFGWALRNDLDMAERFAVETWQWAFLRLDFASMAWSRTVLDTLAPERAGSADLAAIGAIASWALGHPDDGLVLADRAERLATAAGRPTPLRALQARANIASMRADAPVAQQSIMAALEVAKSEGGTYEHCDVQVGLVIGLTALGFHDESRRLADRCLSMAATTGNASLISWARFGRGFSLMATDLVEARREFAESARVAQTVRNRWVHGLATVGLARVDRATGNLRPAAAALDELLERWRAAGVLGMLVATAREAAVLIDSLGRRAAAHEVVGAVARLEAAPMMEFDAQAFGALAEGVEPGPATRREPVRLPSAEQLDSTVALVRSHLAAL